MVLTEKEIDQFMICWKNVSGEKEKVHFWQKLACPTYYVPSIVRLALGQNRFGSYGLLLSLNIYRNAKVAGCGRCVTWII